MELGIDLLGRFGVYRGGREVTSGEFGGRLAGRLVRLLVTRRGEVVTREALIEALWGDRAPADPDANLNVLVNRARRGLGDSGLIATVPGGYVFPSAAAVRIDVERFEVLVRQTRQRRDRGDQPWVLAGAEEALAIWGGAPLAEDTYADWARPHRDRLQRLHQEVLEFGAEAALAVGDPRRAAALAAEAIAQQRSARPRI